MDVGTAANLNASDANSRVGLLTVARVFPHFVEEFQKHTLFFSGFCLHFSPLIHALSASFSTSLMERRHDVGLDTLVRAKGLHAWVVEQAVQTGCCFSFFGASHQHLLPTTPATSKSCTVVLLREGDDHLSRSAGQTFLLQPLCRYSSDDSTSVEKFNKIAPKVQPLLWSSRLFATVEPNHTMLELDLEPVHQALACAATLPHGHPC